MKEYTYLGNKIVIEKCVDDYITLRSKLKEYENKVVKDLKELEFKNGRSTYEELTTTALRYVIEAYRIITENLNSYGVNCDLDMVIENDIDTLLPILELMDKYEEEYLEIYCSVEQMEEYRAYRKANRTRWYGGGFGIEGAMKGAIQAWGLNLASGTVHSVINVAGSTASNLKATYKAVDLAKKYKKVFIKILPLSFKQIERYFLDLNSDTDSGIIMKDYEKAINHKLGKEEFLYSADHTDEEADQRKMIGLLNMLQQVPYSTANYQLLIAEFGDRKHELEELGKKYNVDVLTIKKEILSVEVKKYNINDISFCDKLLELEQFYGYENKSVHDSILDDFVKRNVLYKEFTEKSIKEKILLLNEVERKYSFDCGFARNEIKQYLIKDQKIIINDNIETQEKNLKLIDSLEKEYFIDFSDVINDINNKIEQKKKKLEQENLEKRTIHDFSVENNQISRIQLIVETVEKAESIRADLKKINSIHEKMNFSVYSEELKEQMDEIVQLSDACGYGKELVELLRSKFQHLYEKAHYVYDVRYNTIAEANSVRDELDLIQDIKNNNSDINDILNEVAKHSFKSEEAKKAVANIEESVHIINGIRYDSIEEANDIRNELKQIESIKEKNNNIVSALEETKRHEFKSAEAKKNIEELVKEACTVNDVRYNTVEEAELVRKEMVIINELNSRRLNQVELLRLYKEQKFKTDVGKGVVKKLEKDVIDQYHSIQRNNSRAALKNVLRIPLIIIAIIVVVIGVVCIFTINLIAGLIIAAIGLKIWDVQDDLKESRWGTSQYKNVIVTNNKVIFKGKTSK